MQGGRRRTVGGHLLPGGERVQAYHGERYTGSSGHSHGAQMLRSVSLRQLHHLHLAHLKADAGDGRHDLTRVHNPKLCIIQRRIAPKPIKEQPKATGESRAARRMARCELQASS